MTSKDPRIENTAVLNLIALLPTRKTYTVSAPPTITSAGNAAVVVETNARQRQSIHALFRRAGAEIQYMERRGFEQYYVVYRAVTLPPTGKFMRRAA